MVALVPVAFTKVKFCKVVEPTTKRSPEVLMVVVALPPTRSSLALNIPEKKSVVVAAVVVEFVAVKLAKIPSVSFTMNSTVLPRRNQCVIK